jgi:hypothetical protein
MVAKLSAMTSRSAAGMIESIMVDLYLTLMPNDGAGLPPPGFVAVSRWRRMVSSVSAWSFYFVRFDLRV